MADKIKGLTTKIGADTSDFIKELRKLDKEINQTQKTAIELQKGLNLEFNDSRFILAQKNVQKALKETEAKANSIREKLKLLEESGKIDTNDYQKLQTELAKAETSALKLNNQLKQLDKIKLNNTVNGIDDLSKKLETAAKKTAIFSAGAVGLIAGISKLGSDAAKTGAELQDMSDRLGISAESLQKYNYIALQSGVETEELVKSMSKVRDAVGASLSGETNSSTNALQKLFGSLDLIPTNTEDAFDAVIDALSKVEDSTMQAYYANEIFGEKLATNLIPLINNGSDRLKVLGKEFESIGYLSNEQVQHLADFDDELNIMKERLSLAKTELGMAMLPILKQFADILSNVVVPAIQKVSDWFSNLSEPMQKIISGGLLLVSALSPVLLIMSKLVAVIPTLKKMFNALTSASWQTYAGVAAIATALGLVFDLIGNWSEMSTFEKILKSLALAFLVAAAAATIFHASWSLGFAIGGIVAAVVAGIAAINSAGKSIGVDTNFSDADSIQNSANSNYQIPNTLGNTSNSNYEENQYNIEIIMNPSGDMNYDAKQLADEVIQQMIIKKQANGR